MAGSLGNVTHSKRIMNDLRELYEDKPEGIYIVIDDEDISKMHALIIGPKNTPYENGFFYFYLE